MIQALITITVLVNMCAPHILQPDMTPPPRGEYLSKKSETCWGILNCLNHHSACKHVCHIFTARHDTPRPADQIMLKPINRVLLWIPMDFLGLCGVLDDRYLQAILIILIMEMMMTTYSLTDDDDDEQPPL